MCVLYVCALYAAPAENFSPALVSCRTPHHPITPAGLFLADEDPGNHLHGPPHLLPKLYPLLPSGGKQNGVCWSPKKASQDLLVPSWTAQQQPRGKTSLLSLFKIALCSEIIFPPFISNFSQRYLPKDRGKLALQCPQEDK